jgi:hypothetical protein
MANSELTQRFSGGVYIYAPDKLLTHFSGCLVEGFLELGVTVKTNATSITSRPVSMPLGDRDLSTLQSDPVSGFSAYLVDISTNNAYLPLDGVDSVPVAYITTSDISAFCTVPEKHILFAAHDSTHAVKPGRRIPIAFGLPRRLIQTTENSPALAKRKQHALHSFRPTLQQGVRALMDMAFVPPLSDLIPIHQVNVPPGQYIQELMNSAVCLTYGGDFYSPIVGNTWFEKNQPDLYALHSFRHVENAAVLRWDSWRFWEALAAGCAAVHLNFEDCGFHLPVMPEPWTHYIPIDLSDLAGSARALWEKRDMWPEIAQAGRAWAIEHYAPAPTAARVLQALTA